MYNVVYTKTGEVIKAEFVLTMTKGYTTYCIGQGNPARFYTKLGAWWALRKALKNKNWRVLERGHKNMAPYRKQLFKIMEAPSLN
jgi:hypothetical protein